MTMVNPPPAWPLPPAEAPALQVDAVLQDPASRALLDIIAQVATSEASILLIGESGTDKELIARHIHDSSLRRHRRFVAVNCGALSESLVDTELFGYENGAFPGAFGNQAGCFEAAHEGTLFLDEIDDLSPSMQAKLTRGLREQAITRLGGHQRVPANVRVLAAGSAHLQDLVARGQFRKDLYYHLNVVSLDVLPLHRRPGDILPLARHFIDQYCHRLGYARMQLADDACRQLLAHSWPGNIRELENVIHRTLLLTQGLHIRADDLRLAVPPSATTLPLPPAATATQRRPIDTADTESDLPEPLLQALAELCSQQEDNLEPRVLDALLLLTWRHHRYNQVQAARQLGISRNVLRSRLVRLGVLVPGREPLSHSRAEHLAPPAPAPQSTEST